MLVSLPCNIECEIKFDLAEEMTTISMAFRCSEEPLGEYTLKYDAYPDLRYLLILYFYNEFITSNIRRPHAITLREYADIYEAMFGIKCVYTDKNATIDQLRSHDLPKRILKRAGLSFARGGLCLFAQGEPDRNERDAFRRDLLECFRAKLCEPDISAKAKAKLSSRYETLRGYLWQSPAKYINISRLFEQEIQISDSRYLLYSYTNPISWVSLIEKHRRILLSGTCGSGKSTLLKCIMLDSGVQKKYKVIFKQLVTQPNLFTRAEADEIEKYPHLLHLYLLDGFNELSGEDMSRTRFFSSLERLIAYGNVRVIVSSTSTLGLWLGFSTAELGSIVPTFDQYAQPMALYGTPLIYNAFLSTPGVLRSKLNNAYLVLDYASSIKYSYLIEKADLSRGQILHLGNRVLLPMLGEMLCLKDTLCFDDSDIRCLLENICKNETEENAMLRLSVLNNGFLPVSSSVTSAQQLQAAFNAIIEQGEIQIISKQYMFRHQRIRDYYAVKYELDKLKALLSDYPDRFIRPCLNLGSSATELMQQVMGFTNASLQIPANGLIATLCGKIRRAEIDENSLRTLIKLCFAYAQMFEYIYPYKLKISRYEPHSQSIQVLRKVTDWVCSYPETSKELLEEPQEPELKDMLAFVICKQAEISINFIRTPIPDAPSPDQRIDSCLQFLENASNVIGFHTRLMHDRAKALLYSCELHYQSGASSIASRLLDEGVCILEKCFKNGSFLSGNLLAFMRRSPVPVLMALKPDILDYEASFRINILIAMDPKLHGITSSYARNEAVDALLMGEISLNSYSRLSEIYRLFKNNEDTKSIISRGKGKCGKKELKLARALLDSKGGTLGDTRPFTVFYRFIADWYECLFSGTINKVQDALSAGHLARLKERLLAADVDRSVDLLALCYLSKDSNGCAGYYAALTNELDCYAKRLMELTRSANDPSGIDTDHPYYTCRRFFHFLDLFRQNESSKKQFTSFSEITENLNQCMLDFEKSHLDMLSS